MMWKRESDWEHIYALKPYPCVYISVSVSVRSSFLPLPSASEIVALFDLVLFLLWSGHDPCTSHIELHEKRKTPSDT